MKTKTIITAFLLLFSISSFGQTKEETIEWLNTNGEDLSICQYKLQNDREYMGMKLEKIEDNYIIFKQYYLYGSDGWEIFSKIPVNSILYEDVSTLKIDGEYSLTKIKLNGTSAIKKIVIDKIDGKQTEKIEEEYADYYSFKYKGGDLENVKRVLKAIMHLAKLSGAKENKQTF